MYSSFLRAYIEAIGGIAEIPPERIDLVHQSVLALLGTLSSAVGGVVEPATSRLKTTTQLLLLSNALSQAEPGYPGLDAAHYLIAMGFEQTGALRARLESSWFGESDSPPLENDNWYRLVLAFLHYLAGGYRVQALSVLSTMKDLAERQGDDGHRGLYLSSYESMRALYSGRGDRLAGRSYWSRLLFGPWSEDAGVPERRIARLVQQLNVRRIAALGDLGEQNEGGWLAQRGIIGAAAEDFWRGYLLGLVNRGITTFTEEQLGPGFDTWLRPELDLLVVLPTGSGKTIIGELRSALTLAQGWQVVWLLPTRSLVRQAKQDLARAFEERGVLVEELPVTEDFNPLFITEGFERQRYVAATTPERFAALLRAKPEAIQNVGLVILDEAQILLDEVRGTTAELALFRLKQLVPDCRVVLMTAFTDAQAALERFLATMSRDVARLVSDKRPTRRIYGILTAEDNPERRLVAAMYPPGPQEEDERTENPILIHMGRISLPRTAYNPEMAKRFLVKTHPAGIRSVLFVQLKASTESHASDIARRSGANRDLPSADLARLRVELGRESVVEQSGTHGAAPHHAGLTPLEQHLVEVWLQSGRVNTVVATPTLAQGINLPFDLSIVSFTDRYNVRSGQREELSYAEIQNMLGRAGRAGKVSDGLCLLTVRDAAGLPRDTLDASRRYFFGRSDQDAEFLGLSRLLTLNLGKIVEGSWLVELDGFTFHEAQAIVAFALHAAGDATDDRLSETIQETILRYPSLAQLEADSINEVGRALTGLVVHVRQQHNDSILLEALLRTGMPVEVLNSFLEALRRDEYFEAREQDALVEWADGLVYDTVLSCNARAWYNSLVGKADLADAFGRISAWRRGATLVEIEGAWPLKRKVGPNRIAVGEFVNHELPVYTQFWGALAVCESALYAESPEILDQSLLQKLPTFTREGVTSEIQYEWLGIMGKLDRVLAHRLADVVVAPDIEGRDRRRFLRDRLREWKYRPEAIPIDDETARQAVIGVVEEVLGD